MSESRNLKGQCANCGCRLQFKTHLAEMVVVCPKCNSQVTVSAVAATPPAATRPAQAKLHAFPCPNCGSQLEVKHELIGKLMKCGECEQKIRVPPSPRRRRSNGEEGDEGEEQADGSLSLGDWLVCMFLPIPLGFLVGCVRLIQGKSNGGPMIGYSILFAIVWLAIRLLFFVLASLTSH